MVSKLCAKGITPVVEMASCEGRNPRIPQYDAGTLTLPPMSVPMIARTFWLNLLRTSQETQKLFFKKSTSCAPTATANPPGTQSSTHGFLGVPKCLFSPFMLPKQGHSIISHQL